MPASAGDREVILEVEDLVKWFSVTRGTAVRRKQPDIKAVNGVSFTLRRGETLGIVGESGCGKSTVARTIVGLEQPTSGRALYKGEDIFGMSRRRMRRLRREIQMIFQDPYASLNPRMTVADIVAEGWRIHHDLVPKGQQVARAKELLQRVGLDPDDADRFPHQFSGGQRQRIGIARALALQPELIVCDEPVSALDVSVQAQVVNLLEDIQDDFGLSYIFIAHDLSVVRHISDRVAVMYLGRVVEYGDEEAIYAAPTHPYTQALLSAVPIPDPEATAARDERYVLEGDLPSPSDLPSGCTFRTRCWKAEERCAEEEPELIDRGGFGHPARCHFAEPLDRSAAAGTAPR